MRPDASTTQTFTSTTTTTTTNPETTEYHSTSTTEPMTKFECGNRLVISGTQSALEILNGLWTLAMNSDGEVQFNDGYPYYKQRGSENFMWWMWHGTVGHWVVNDSPGIHGADLVKSVFGPFECPQIKTQWEVIIICLIRNSIKKCA